MVMDEAVGPSVKITEVTSVGLVASRILGLMARIHRLAQTMSISNCKMSTSLSRTPCAG
jgi:hypothetical protein